MAAFAALLVIVALAAVNSANAISIGGATSVEKYAGQLCLSNKALYGTYSSVGSSAGISGFIGRSYQVAFSDVALSASQDVQAGGTSKLSVPFTVATYSFFTKKASGIRLTTDQVAKIYTSGASWSQIKAGLSGNVIPVARADGSGTTEVICRWLAKSSIWPASIKSPACTSASWSGKRGISGSVVFKSGSNGIGEFLAGNANALGYMQTGIGATTYRLFPAAIKNLGGNFVAAAGTTDRGDIYAALPRTVRALNLPWNDVDLIDVAGPSTYPICALAFEFAKLKGGATVKKFVLYSMSSSAQGLATQFTFDPLPRQFTAAGITWAKKIV